MTCPPRHLPPNRYQEFLLNGKPSQVPRVRAGESGMNEGVRVLPSGDQCLISAALPGVTDIVPSFTCVGLHYRAEAVPMQGNEAPLAALSRAVEALLATPWEASEETPRVVEIPVCYGGEFGPDFDEVAQTCGLAHEELIRLHTGTTGHVFMLGFVPGHPYIGLWDERLALPRRSTPRTRVPAGTVAIANRQSIVYPFDSPGGWNLIGRTPCVMFHPKRASPCLLSPGDGVRFVAISPAEFTAMQTTALGPR